MTVHSNHSDFIQKATSIVEAHIDNDQFGVNELAREMGMSRSNLHRKVKSVTGSSISKFISRVRLERAKELLMESSSTISEIAFETGFHSVSYFTKCFHDHFGYTPGEARNSNQETPGPVDFHRNRAGKWFFGKKISIAYLFVMSTIIITMVLLIIFKPFASRSFPMDKSVAVLPFRNDSPERENESIINGYMESILNNLSKIKDLRVLDRSSVEQYRNNPKTSADIAEELNVGYLLGGSGQKLGNRIMLTVQLSDADGTVLWSNPYDRKITKVEDHIALQSEIAQLVAHELQAVITPEEKQRIEKSPTASLTAYEFYMRAKVEHRKHILKWNDMEAVERAEELYHHALDYDSTFAIAYVGLAEVYWHKHYGDVLSENYLDSMLILLNIALSFDAQLARAYQKRGDYYRVNNDKEQAIKEYDKALELNPNDWVVYFNSTINLYDDEAIIIENLLKAASLHRGYYLSRLYRYIAFHLSAFSKEKSEYYLEEALKLDDDSADHFLALTRIEGRSGDFKKAIEFGKKSYAFDSTFNSVIYRLGKDHSYLGQYEESLEYFKKYKKRLKTLDRRITGGALFQIGYAYWVNGFQEKGEYYIDEGLKFYNKMLELNRISPQDFHTLHSFAAAYAFLGERVKSYGYLRLVAQKQMMPKWMVSVLNYDSMFDNIRDEPEFQQIVRDVEAKYQSEHERVRQWLEENDMI